MSDYKEKYDLSESEAAFLDTFAKPNPESSTAGCPECENRGYTLNSDGLVVNCRCWKDRLYAEKYRESGVPPAFFGKTLAADWNLRQDAFGEDLGIHAARKQKIYNLMSKYIKAIPAICAGLPLRLRHRDGTVTKVASIRLIGGNASGKTLLAAIAAQTSIRSGLNTRFFDFTELCSVLTDYHNPELIREAAEDFKTADLIVIDGITNYLINLPSFVFELDRLSRIRLNSGKPIILTCFPDYRQFRAGQSFESLLESTFPVELPTTKPPAPRYS